MPKHRHLSLKTFIHAVPWDLFQRYSDQLEVENRPSGWAFINVQAMEAFLSEPENAEAAGGIVEDFKRMNDLCGHGMGNLVRAYNRYLIRFDQGTPAQELAMQLFLNHREAFEFAWSRYLFYGSPSKLSRHPFAVSGLTASEAKLALFRTHVQKWFSGLAKGSECQVHSFEDEGEVIIRVSRGSYMRTVACWERENITFRTFRPASEDLLVYDHATSTLSIKASLDKERQQYLKLFATHIVGDPTLAEAASREHVFSLLPLQEERFDYGGDGVITGVDLVKVRLKLRGQGDASIDIRSEDVRKTLDDGAWGLSLRSGEMGLARFRFHLRPQGEKPQTVTFEVEPPARTDLTQKRYADIIERYLVEQGVKLL